MSDPLGQTGRMKNELTPTPTEQSAANRRAIRPAQLDFTLPTPAVIRRTARRVGVCSHERAVWWFAQMRRVVDEGREVEVTGVW